MSGTQFLDRARELAAAHFTAYIKVAEPGDFYVVWFCKALQNWKALVSTDLVPGVYYEVTHNGDKAETYVDMYVKQDNATFPDRAAA